MSTFLQLQDAVLADSFDATAKRTQAKTWINQAYGAILDSAEWAFMDYSEAVKVTAGSQAVSEISSSFGVATALYRADGTPLEPIVEYRDFAARYVGTTLSAVRGLPEAFCVVGSEVFVGPTSSETSTAYLLVGEKAVVELSADGDTPILPAHYHIGLVYAAKATGYALSERVLAQEYSALAEQTFAPMYRKYLRAMRGSATQSVAYRPGG